jgi:hypothetical protein
VLECAVCFVDLESRVLEQRTILERELEGIAALIEKAAGKDRLADDLLD